MECLVIAAWALTAVSVSAFVVALIWFARNVKRMEKNND